MQCIFYGVIITTNAACTACTVQSELFRGSGSRQHRFPCAQAGVGGGGVAAPTRGIGALKGSTMAMQNAGIVVHLTGTT